MSDLDPRAFDIETSGLDQNAVITVAGVATDMGSWLALNTGGRPAEKAALEAAIKRESKSNVRLCLCEDEASLLSALSSFAKEHIDGDEHYLTAYNGETWNQGFDLPFVRSACVRCGVDWPFPDIAYADVMTMMNRFDTADHNDLVGVYRRLVGEDDCDPFEDSGSAVRAYEAGEWTELLLHNLADIERTRELALLAGRYVPKSDFRMKNLSPPRR